MKRLFSAIAVLIACTALTACTTAGENNSTIVEQGVNKRSLEGMKLSKPYSGFDYTVDNVKTFEDLEKYSDLIVIGEFTDNSSVCFRGTYINGFQQEVESQVLSTCPMRITKVLAGDASVGDIVNVLQEEHVRDDGNLFSRSKLTPMQMGDEWLFCLEYCDDERVAENSYWCVSDNKGRYPTANASSNETVCFSDYPELGVYKRSDFCEDFYNKLKEKYDL